MSSKRLIALILVVVISMALYIAWTVRQLSQTTTPGENKIVRTQSAFCTDKITNISPFTLTIERISFTNLPENAQLATELYEWNGGPYSYIQKDVPDSFSLREGHIQIKPGEEKTIGFILRSVDGKEITATGMVYHCRLGSFSVKVKSRLICTIVPSSQ